VSRPRPRVEGKYNPGAIGKEESPVGNMGRSVPKQLTSTRAEAASKLLQKYGKSKRPLKTGQFTSTFDPCSGTTTVTDED